MIAYGTFVVLGLFDGLLGVAWPSLRNSFDQPVDALGVLLAVSVTGHITASMANGRFLNRFSISVLLVSSALLLASGALIQVGATSWWFVLLGALFIGMGMGMLDAGLNTYAAAEFRPRLLNWLHASFGLGTTLGALIMTTLLSFNQTWRAGVGLMAGMYLILLTVFWLTRRRWAIDSVATAVDLPPPTAVTRTRETLKQPIVWLCILLFFLYTGIEIGVGHWAFTLFTESRGVVEETAGLWTTIYWASFMGGRILLGFIETNLTRLIRWAMCGTLLGISLLAIPALPWMGLVGLIIIGISVAPIFPALVALTPQRVGRQHAPNAIGFEIGAAGLGGAAIPALTGVLGDSLGLEVIPLFLLFVALLLIGLHEYLVRVGDKRSFAPLPSPPP